MTMTRVALVTHTLDGGVGTMTRYLHRILAESGRYAPELISLATSYKDAASVRLSAPNTWLSNPGVQSRQMDGFSYRHVGARWPELEFQRNRPRAVLNELLATCNLVQFVVGAPYWAACAGKHLGRPVLLWTATTTLADRRSRLRHAPFVLKTWGWLMAAIQQRAERRALERVDHAFALSAYTAQTIKPWAGANKISVAMCGVDTTAFYPGTAATPPYMLCVGRLSDRRKNLQLLLNAYAKAKRRSKAVPDLYLVGDLPEAIDRWLAQLGIQGGVRLLGECFGADLADLYRRAQFLVLSSDEEGLGIVILEAMASGIPAISTDCGGPASAITHGQTGLLTPIGDSDALAAAIQTLAEDPALCRRMGRAARDAAERRFSLPATGKVFLDTYDALLAARRSEEP